MRFLVAESGVLSKLGESAAHITAAPYPAPLWVCSLLCSLLSHPAPSLLTLAQPPSSQQRCFSLGSGGPGCPCRHCLQGWGQERRDVSLPIKSPGAAKGFSISSSSKPGESACQRSSRLGTRRGSCRDQEAARPVRTQGTQSPSLCRAHSRTQGSARPAGATGPQPHPRHAPTASLPVLWPQ